MSDVEYCVKNMRTQSVMGIFDSKQEAIKEARQLNRRYQTNEYWTLDYKKVNGDD